MENVDLFDKVAVLAPGGRLAYFGPPGQAKSYFAIEKFTQLYDRLEQKTPGAWQEQFRKSPLCRQHLRPALDGALGKAASRPRRALPAARFGSALNQWSVLAHRFARVLFSDKQNLALLLAQPLLIAGLICLIFRQPPLIGFLVVLSALWFGCSGAAQQIVKERSIYRRERTVNLRLDAYIASKFLPLALLSAAQGMLMLFIVWLLRSDDAQTLQGRLIQALGVLLASWNGVAMGLAISALSTNADKAMAVVPLVLMPQIMLAGVMVALPDMNMPTWIASHLAVSRWANQVGEIGLLQGRALDDQFLVDEAYYRPRWNLYPDYDMAKDGLTRFKDEFGPRISRMRLLLSDVAVLVVFMTVQLVCVAFILRRQDAW
jgi:hypothetical protein